MDASDNKIGIYAPHFYDYIKLVENEELENVLQDQLKATEDFLKGIPPEKHLFKYAEGKWSIKEVIQHIIDTERVFAFRVLAFSRKDVNTLPSMDENRYAENSDADHRNWQDLIDELTTVRKSTIFLFDSFTPDQSQRVGKAGNYEMSVKAMGYTIAGHLQHHLNILKDRYLA